MRTFLESELKQLLTPTEAANRKGWTLNTFKYRAKKVGAPRRIEVGDREIFYDPAEVDAWKPPTQPKKQRLKQGE